MAVPRDNKRKFVSSANNLEVTDGKNDNSNAEQNNPEEIAAANKIPISAFGNENAKNLFDEMRTLLARIEQKQIEQAKVWRQRPKVFEKVQEKKMEMLGQKLCDEPNEKEEIGKSRSAGTIRIDPKDEGNNYSMENAINNGGKTGANASNFMNNVNESSKEMQQIIAGMENILQRYLATTAKQQNINNKNCSKNAKEQPKIDKIIPTIKQSFKSPPNQQQTREIRPKNVYTIGNEFGLKVCPVPNFQCQSHPFQIFDKKESDVPNKQFTIRQKISSNNIIQNLPMNHFVPVEGTHFLAEWGRLTHQFEKFQLKIIPKMNTAWIGIGCLQLNWNFFPSVKPKRNNKRVVWHPPISFRIFADFAKHDWSMIAKISMKWNLGKIGWEKIGNSENSSQFHENIWEPSCAFPSFATTKIVEVPTRWMKNCPRVEALSEDGGM